MDRIQTLAAELARPEHQNQIESAICAVLNARTIPVLREAWLTDRGLFALLGAAESVPIREALRQSTDPALSWAWEMMTDRGAQGIDISLPEARAMIQMLAADAAFPLSQEAAAKILALAETMVSRAEQMGIGEVSGQDVRAAWEVM